MLMSGLLGRHLTNSRWLKPIERFREDLYLYSPNGAQYTADGLRARWGRWLADTK